MTKTTHTPGPWTWTLKPYGELTDDDACAEVSVVNSAGVCRIADADLIAAAPDLLDACEAGLEAVCSMRCPNTWRTADGPPPHSPVCAAMRAAIRKARGGA